MRHHLGPSNATNLPMNKLVGGAGSPPPALTVGPTTSSRYCDNPEEIWDFGKARDTLHAANYKLCRG